MSTEANDATGNATTPRSRKKKVRGGHKAHLTRLITDIDRCITGYTSDREPEILTYKSCLERKADVISKLDEDILEEIEDEQEIAAEIDATEICQNRIRKKIIEIEMALKKPVDEENPITEPTAKTNVKLPKLEIEKFNGEPKKYITFRDAFNVAVVKNTGLSDSEKFTYLKGLLSGEAARLVAGMALTNDNFKEAMQLIEKRFGNKQVIINSHMEALMKIAPVKYSDDTKGIRLLYDKVDINLRSLKALGVDSDAYGCLLVSVMKTKLPNEINLIISRKFEGSDDIWNIDEMMKVLGAELDARERISNNAIQNPVQRQPFTTEGLLTQEREVVCPYCEKGHFPDKCRTVTNIDRRIEILKTKKRCFCCTKSGHNKKDCRSRRSCFICKGRHHTSICTGRQGRNDRNKDNFSSAEKCDVNTTTAINMNMSVLLQTASVQVGDTANSEKSIKCRLILDTGSQKTYITEKLRSRIGLKKCKKEVMCIGAFGGGTKGPKEYDVVEVAVSSVRRSETLYMKAVVVKNICSPLQGQEINVAHSSYLHLKNLQLADNNERGHLEVEMLVGLDNYWRVVTGGVIRGNEGPVAIASKFGYILSGPTNEVTVHNQVRPSINMLINASNVENNEERLIEKLVKFWDLESMGIINEQKRKIDFYGKFEFLENKYVVSLPWKDDHALLGDNYVLAEKRRFSQLHRLKKDPNIMHRYQKIMEEQESEGIIEEVNEELPSSVGSTYYMPHQAVLREDKDTTKLRIVYDASSKMLNELSLNDCLEVGETYFADLFGVMVRFRWHRIGLLADIEKAFLSIGIQEKDRDALRFLWSQDPSAEKQEIRKMRFTRVCFGVASSMWHLGATIKHHLDKYRRICEDEVDKIESALYVDDFSGGAQHEKEAIRLYEKSREIFKEAGMNLRKWRSNNRMVNDVITEKSGYEENKMESHAQRMLNPSDTSEVKVLGIPWDTDKDEMEFNFKNLLKKVDSDFITKRKLLMLTASIYDPLGMLSPAVLPLKLIFQKMCKDGGLWNDSLSTSCLEEWSEWLQSARECKSFNIPRCYYSKVDEPRNVSLVGFCDASEKAYAAVIYIRVVGDSGVSTSLIASKTRVAPLKKQTIPRMELLGAMILARLMQKIREIMKTIVPINTELCFTDSTVTLNWIQNENKTYGQYVQNRIVEIRKLTSIHFWYHISGQDNIADLPSRGCVPEQLQKLQGEWFQGPEWLKKCIDEWPIKQSIVEDNRHDELIKEVASEKCVIISLVKDEVNIQKVIDPERYSSFEKLLRVTSWCLRFVNAFKYEKKEREELSAEEMDGAKAKWIKSMQIDLKEQPTYKKVKDSLGIQEDKNGYLRCKGRFGRGKMPFQSMFPLILPSFHWVTELIIRECHDRVFHNGVKETLAEIRNTYWIIKGRQRVKAVIRRCTLCKLLEGLPYPRPTTADLPKFRINGGKAFETAGVDFCGPVYVKTIYQVNYEKMNKAYIVLLTCATSRMIHLELAPDLTTETYIRSQQRFMARRGIPRLIVSDNGRTFKGRKLKRFNAAKGIRWRFNLAKAPWWGGMFERMIRATKRCLKKAIGSRRLTYEQLYTVLTEIEAVINSRPITFLYVDDVEEPLTPSHLFCGRRLLGSDDSTVPLADETEFTRTSMIEDFQKIESVVNHFWERWYKEYLMNLRDSHKIHRGKDLEISVGDVVLIREDDVKRNNWKLGRIEKLIEGRDGVVRGAELKTTQKGAIGRICRPLQKLHPLELGNKDECDVSTKKKNDHNEVIDAQISVEDSVPENIREDVEEGLHDDCTYMRAHAKGNRPRRIAGIDGEYRRRLIERL